MSGGDTHFFVSLEVAGKLQPQSHAMGDDDYHFRHRIDFSPTKERVSVLLQIDKNNLHLGIIISLAKE